MSVDIFQWKPGEPIDDSDVIQFLQELYEDCDRVDEMKPGFKRDGLMADISHQAMWFPNVVRDQDRQKKLCQTTLERCYGL
jgi:hypothetical protein